MPHANILKAHAKKRKWQKKRRRFTRQQLVVDPPENPVVSDPQRSVDLSELEYEREHLRCSCQILDDLQKSGKKYSTMELWDMFHPSFSQPAMALPQIALPYHEMKFH